MTEPTRGIHAPENAYICISCTIYNPQVKAIPYMINIGYKAPGHLNSNKLGLREFGKHLQRYYDSYMEARKKPAKSKNPFHGKTAGNLGRNHGQTLSSKQPILQGFTVQRK